MYARIITIIVLLLPFYSLAKEAHEYTNSELKAAGWTDKQITSLRDEVGKSVESDESTTLYIDHYCAYFHSDNPGSIHKFKPSRDVESAINEVMAVTGLPKNFEVIAGGVPNAAALIYKGRRVIAYNQSFLYDIESRTGSRWPAYSIMAHEIGHHLAGHTLSSYQGIQENHLIELEADKYSGFAMQRMGASLEEAQLVMSLVASDNGSIHTLQRGIGLLL